ncbi:hypothetical protein [Stenotrophomonas nematodicola]|uniref:Uncharacterized protein n=1 Tax=Stenotrophomonas nematodicola TaxID=2656746 RepID=A0ABW7CX01_9GAMM
MNSQQFVAALEAYVQDAATDATISVLQSPPGRRPPQARRERSAWYNGLSAQDQAQVRSVVAEATATTLFGMLAVLDGARVVDDEKGRFELFHTGGERTLLNPDGIDLHDLLRRADDETG